MRFAAIDVGSNAVRLLVSRIDEAGDNPLVKKEALFRVPLRLGDDVFGQRNISEESARKLIDTMKAFRSLLDVFQPRDFLACATSAMRDSGNGPALVEEIARVTDIRLEIIDGSREADIIFACHVERDLDPHQSYLFIDVGGGSTELMLYHQGKVHCSRSFNIGGVRLLNQAVPDGEWARLKQWVVREIRPYSPQAIGSGGNISRLNRMGKRDESKPLSHKKLQLLLHQLSLMSEEERIRTFRIKPDRADVIVPAGTVYLKVMTWSKASRIHVPRFGLADGLIRLLYERHRRDGAAQPARPSSGLTE